MSGPAEPTRRLFFALWPDAGARMALNHAAAPAVRHCGGRPVPAHNLHVTLAFLGSVADTRSADLERLAGRCAAALAEPAPLTLRWVRLEHWARPQLLAALAEEAPAVTALAAALNAAAAAEGFSPDLKPFRAHVTLVRKVTKSPPPAPLPALTWRFDGFVLVASRTEPEGSVYSIVASFPLVAAP